jgi:hypothetical protein
MKMPARHPHCLRVVGLACAMAALGARAEIQSNDATFRSLFGVTPIGTIPSVSAAARLDFTLNIERMIFLRVGAGGSQSGGTSGSGPAASGSVSTVTLSVTPSIPAGSTTPLPGSNQGVAWNGTAPGFLAAAPVVVPVEVRSNAGAVRLSGQVTTPLTSGANTLPMSAITIVSSDAANLPAPSVPNSGPGATVNVATGGPGTAAAPGLLTQRSANWTFGLNPGASPAPGSYSGTVTFTATSL